MYNYNKLIAKIKEFGDINKLAETTKIDKRVIADKLGNLRCFKQNEIESICLALKIPRKDIFSYFFDIISCDFHI